MTTLHKFEFIATQCSARSPARSPVLRLRRRKTLKMLLNRAASSGRRLPSDFENSAVESRGSEGDNRRSKEGNRSRRKLKDLFVSSPSPPSEDRAEIRDMRRDTSPTATGSSIGHDARGIETSSSLRPVSAIFRHQRFRILRRHWRPVLVTIPEQ